MLKKILRPGRTYKHQINALWKSDLNKQYDFQRVVLFRNGVTKSN